MRPLLILLLAANLLMFAWGQGWLDRLRRSDGLPEQVHPERLRVVPIDRLGDPPSPAPPPLPSNGPAPVKARSTQPFGPPPATPSSSPVRTPPDEAFPVQEPLPVRERLPAPRRSPPRETLPMPFAEGSSAAPLRS